jgi:hypothetical protein
VEREQLTALAQALTSGQAAAVCPWKAASVSAQLSVHSAPRQTE